MANKSLNFNEFNRPVLELTMQDNEKTVIKVTTPTESLVRELEATLPELQKVLQTPGEEATELCYDLAARLISCNRSFLTVTAEELKNKYKLDYECLVAFYAIYIEFIQGINSAKN